MTQKNEIRPDVWAALRGCRLWHTAGDESVTQLAETGRVKDVPRGTRLATEGDRADEFGVMVAGNARVFYLGADGRQITFEVLGPRDPLAAVAALAGSRYPANIEASTPATVVLLGREALFVMMDREPQVARTLIADLANRVVNFTSVVQTLALDVPSRVAHYVFQRALSSGTPAAGGLRVELGMKKSELAMALGTVPETLSRAFGKLRDEGVMEVQGSIVTVLDMRALAALGSGFSE